MAVYQECNTVRQIRMYEFFMRSCKTLLATPVVLCNVFLPVFGPYLGGGVPVFCFKG